MTEDEVLELRKQVSNEMISLEEEVHTIIEQARHDVYKIVSSVALVLDRKLEKMEEEGSRIKPA